MLNRVLTMANQFSSCDSITDTVRCRDCIDSIIFNTNIINDQTITNEETFYFSKNLPFFQKIFFFQKIHSNLRVNFLFNVSDNITIVNIATINITSGPCDFWFWICINFHFKRNRFEWNGNLIFKTFNFWFQ